MSWNAWLFLHVPAFFSSGKESKIFPEKMSQAAIFEAKKLLRRQIKKRLSQMSDETRAKESRIICEKVET